jgi:ribonuclease VapC
MVIDTSAIIAILFEEPEAQWLKAAILKDAVRIMSAASLIESSIVVIRRHGDRGSDKLDNFVLEMQIAVIPVSLPQAELARRAHRQYGRGNHKAALNFGDCFSYALAKIWVQSFLYKGNDFTLTDLVLISPPPSPQNK